MILDCRAATLGDADSVADVYLRSRKELVACAPLELARSELPPPIRLYTFQCNQPARIFFERRGFGAIAFGDGSGNEEKCPDILYEWQPGR